MRFAEISSKNKWEKFIADNSQQSFFQSWNWGEVTKNIEGVESTVKRLGFYLNSRLAAVAQTSLIKARRGTFLHVRHGPVFKKFNKVNLSAVTRILDTVATSLKASFIRISPLVDNSPFNKLIARSCGFINAPIHALDGEYCWVLDLNSDEQALLANFRKTSRYLIRQAQNMGVKIQISTQIDDIDKFIELYKTTAKRHKFVMHQGIKEEFTCLVKDKQAILLNGFYNEQLLASSIVLFYGHQAIYHHSASINAKIPVNYLLQWEAIRYARKRGMKLYNFWGIAPSDKPRHPWQGLTVFKKGFGGRTIEYLHAQDKPLSPLYWATYIIESIRKIKKGY